MGGYGRHRSIFNAAYTAAYKEHSNSPNDNSLAQGAGARTEASCNAATATATAAAYLSLQHEMNRDLLRLWTRNLGRDDRSIADCGREAWFPYLDEGVVVGLQATPIEMIVDFSLPQGTGDKSVLRRAAANLGLGPQFSGLVKRAIQFGSRVAQHTNRQYGSSNRKAKGDMEI
mmetsp:Transcript_119/g.202  ORF Transcript_119/g.202 Transcript_119/m.202 type:complete len:173 (+) Transcript_119:232-750(+)